MQEREQGYCLPHFELFLEGRSFPYPAGLAKEKPCDLLLINTPLCSYSRGEMRSYVPNAPLGEGYILSFVADFGFNCGLIDGEGLGLTPEQIIKAAYNVRPRNIGINLFSPISQFTMDIIEGLGSQSQIIVGGPHATFCPEEILKEESNISIVVRGEGEETVKEILEGKSLDEIRGVSFRQGEQIIHNPSRKFIKDLDSLPFIDRNYFEVDPYKRGEYIVSSISTSRGCSYKCTFCGGPELLGRRIRFRSMKNVAEELRRLIEGRHGVNYIRFIDDFFLVTERRTREFLRELQTQNLMGKFRWDSLIRADAILRLSDEHLLNLKKSGVEFLAIGVESGNPERLKSIKKGVHLEAIERAVEQCHNFGIPLKGFFILGFPNETEEEMWQTINFAHKLHKKGMVKATFNELAPYPGTEIWSELLTQGWDHQDLTDYQRVNLLNSSDREDVKNYLRERGKHYTGLRKSISAVSSERLRKILREAVLSFDSSGLLFYDG